VLLRTGLDMEPFLDKACEPRRNQASLVVIDSSRGVATIDSRQEPGTSQENDQAHGHAHGEVIRHIWLASAAGGCSGGKTFGTG